MPLPSYPHHVSSPFALFSKHQTGKLPQGQLALTLFLPVPVPPTSDWGLKMPSSLILGLRQPIASTVPETQKVTKWQNLYHTDSQALPEGLQIRRSAYGPDITAWPVVLLVVSSQIWQHIKIAWKAIKTFNTQATP
jgi:hypothetical protein